MRVELVVTGTELAEGRTVDTNSPWLLRRLEPTVHGQHRLLPQRRMHRCLTSPR